MATSRPTGLWVRVQLYFKFDQKQFSNIFWYIPSAAPPIASLEAEAGNIVTALIGAFTPILSNSVTILGGYCEFNDGTTTYGVENYDNTVGGVTGDAMPEEVALVVQRYSAAAGSGGRGRIKVSGLPETFVTGSYIAVPTGSAPLATFTAAMQVPPMATTTYTPAVFDKSGTGTLQPTVFWDFTGLLGTQRRRRTNF